MHRHIDEVAPAEWDALLGPADVQLSHRFVKTCQDAGVEDATYRHVLLYDREGLACIATFSFMQVALELLTSRRLRRAVRAARRVRPGFLRIPVLFCGLPVSFGRPCVRMRPGADADACVTVLCELMDDVAAELGAEICCFKEFELPEVAPLESVCRHGYFRAASLPSCRLDIRWTTFDAYLGSMRAGYRRQVREARRVAQGSGLLLRAVDDFGSCGARLFGLYEQVMERVEFQLERLNPAFFAGLNRNFPGESRAVLAEWEGEVVAAAVLLQAGGSCAFLLAGIDYARNAACRAYVNVVTETVADAIRRGAAVLEMGQTSYDLKRRLGATTTPRILFLRHRTRWAHRLLRAGGEILFPSRTYADRRVFRS